MASDEQYERMETIVAGTDGSAGAERALREAARLARATGSRLVLVGAFSDLHPYREQIQGSAREDLISLERVARRTPMMSASAGLKL